MSVLKTLPSESVDCVVTSPPYWALRDYGTAKWEGGSATCDHKVGRDTRKSNAWMEQKLCRGSFGDEAIKNGQLCPKCGAKRIDKQLGLEPTFQEYINKLCDIFDEVKRVLKKSGTCWVNMGDTYYGSGNGTDKTDQEPFGKQVYKLPYENEKNRTRGWERPSRDEFSNAGIDKNCIICGKPIKGKGNRQFCSTKCLNTKGNDFRTQYRLLPDKTLCQIPSRFAIEMSNRGWILRNEIIWHKPNCMPSSVKDRFTVDFEKVFFFVKSKKYWFETQLEQATYTDSRAEKGRVEYKNRNTKCGVVSGRKAFNSKYGGGGSGFVGHSGYSSLDNPYVRNKRCVWVVTTKPFKEAHFATYPEALIEPMIQAGCPIGGVVLDPFIGSGTTGVVAKKQNKNYIGIELNPDYVKMAEKRIKAVPERLI